MDDLHTFDDARGWHAFLSDAYRGGWAWEHPSSPTLGSARLYGFDVRRDSTTGREVVVEVPLGEERTYLVPWSGETKANFARRRHLAFYVNLAEPVVDAYVDTVTPDVKRELGDAESYLSDLDGEGSSWGDHVGTVARLMAVHGAVAVVIEPPKRNASTTRAEEVAAGVSLRARAIPPTAWAWLKIDDDGPADFAYADDATFDATRAGTAQRVTLWRYTRTEWMRFTATIPPGGTVAGIAPSVMLGAPDERGPVAVPGRLPVVFAVHRRDVLSRVPSGRSLAASPAAIGRQVYQLLSQVEDTQRRAPPFLSMPTAARGGLEPEVSAKLGPDTALPSPEGAGTPSWVTFPSESLADLRAHVVFLVAMAYRVSGLSVEADTTAQVQSGEALRVRSRDFEARAKRFAEDCASYERKALALVGNVLGLAPGFAHVQYPKRFVLGDPAELLSAALLVLQHLGDTMGTEGFAETMRQALGAALAIDDARLAELVDEATAKLAARNADAAAVAAAANAPATTDTTGAVARAADSALNGAQVAAMVAIVEKVELRDIPRDSGAAIISRAFLVDPSGAEAILGSAGQGSRPPSPPAAPTRAARIAVDEGTDEGSED